MDALAISLLLLVGCDGGGSGSVAAPTVQVPPSATGQPPAASANGGTATGAVPDACTLVTSEQIRAATGDDPGELTSSQVGAGTSRACTFDTLVVFVRHAGGVRRPRRELRDRQTGLRGELGEADRVDRRPRPGGLLGSSRLPDVRPRRGPLRHGGLRQAWRPGETDRAGQADPGDDAREPVTRDRIGQSCPPETRGPDS